MNGPAHEIVWIFDVDHVRCELKCMDEDCINRYRCAEGCDTYYNVVRHEDGTVTHGAWLDLEGKEPHHQMVRTEECAFEVWMDEDPGLLPELNDARETFEIGRTPAKPVWNGDDEGPTWSRAE